MILTTQLRTLLTVGALAASAVNASAAFINTGWEYTSNWDALTAGYFGGIASPGTWSSGIAPTSGWQAVTKAAGTESNAGYIAADKSVELIKTAGGHYAASSGLYAWSGTGSTFNFNVDLDVSGWESVVFQQNTIPNPDAITTPVLIVGGERYSALAEELLFAGSTWVDAIGQEAVVEEIAYQWDLRGLDLSNGFVIEYEASVHQTMVAFQLAGTEVFEAVVVPEPSTYALILGGVVLCGVCWQRRRKAD